VLYVDAVAANPTHPDIEALELLEDLQGRARQDRAELIEWLLARGFDVDQIGGEFSPMLLPAIRMIGDDGTLACSGQISAEFPTPEANVSSTSILRVNTPP
jgi:adenylate cyclase